jgi:hypothetical protein
MKIKIEVLAEGGNMSPKKQERLLRELRTEVTWAVERHPIEVTEVLVESPLCEPPPAPPDDGLPAPVDLPPIEITPRRLIDLPLGSGLLCCLHDAGIKDLSQLVKQTADDLFKVPGVGPEDVMQVVDVLTDLRLSLREPQPLDWRAKANPGAVYVAEGYFSADFVTADARKALKRYAIEPEEVPSDVAGAKPMFRVPLPKGTIVAPRAGDRDPIAYGAAFMMPDLEFILAAEAERDGDPIVLRVFFAQPEKADADKAQ